jgi:hypothetical protein
MIKCLFSEFEFALNTVSRWVGDGIFVFWVFPGKEEELVGLEIVLNKFLHRVANHLDVTDETDALLVRLFNLVSNNALVSGRYNCNKQVHHYNEINESCNCERNPCHAI